MWVDLNYLVGATSAAGGCLPNSDFPNLIIVQLKCCTEKFFAANLTFTVCPILDQLEYYFAQHPIIESLADLD